MIMPRVSNMAGICAQMPTLGLSCSLEWLCFRSSPVWCKNPKNNEFRTKKFPNQEFLYGISSFCTLSENNSFLHGKISCFCIFLAKNGVYNTNRTPRVVYGSPTLRAMHPIHKCVAKGTPLTNIFLTDLPCPVSPRADPHRCVRSDHRKRSAYR